MLFPLYKEEETEVLRDSDVMLQNQDLNPALLGSRAAGSAPCYFLSDDPSFLSF